MGTPSKDLPDNKTKQITFRVTNDDYEILKELGYQLRKPMAHIVYEAVMSDVENHLKKGGKK